MSDMTVEATLVIPVHNEEGNLSLIVNEINGAFTGWTYEILFVDDGSTDGTAEEMKRLKERFPFVKIVTHSVRCGKSTALVTGGRFANYPWIATMDGDGQDDPRDAVTMLEVAARAEKEGTDHFLCVCGHRQNRKDTTVKRISSRIANGVRRRVLKDDTPDTACGLKVFRREDFLTIPHFTNMHRFFPALFVRSGGRTVSVKVNNRPRQRGISKYGFHNRLWVGILDMCGVMWLMRRPANPRVIEDGKLNAG